MLLNDIFKIAGEDGSIPQCVQIVAAAGSAAKYCVLIPASYTGTESFTNPTNVPILDLRAPAFSTGLGGPLSKPQFGSYLLSVTNAGFVTAQNLVTGNTDFSGLDAALVIRNVIGNMPGGGIIFFKNGIYNLNSVVQETTGGFSQYYAIGFPSGGPNQYLTYNLEGESFTSLQDEFGTPVQTNGVILNLTTTAENSVPANSVIFGLWARPDTIHSSGVSVGLKNIDVRINTNQRGNETAIDLSQSLNTDLDHVMADTNVSQGSVPFPVAGTAGQYGITTSSSSKEENNWRNVYAVGYNVGLDIQSEHSALDNVYPLNCNIGIQYGVRGGNIYHPSSWRQVGPGECKRGLLLGANLQAGSLLEISGLDFEDATASISPLFQPVYHALETTAGNSFGRISYTRVLAGVGLSTLATLFDGGGGTNFTPVTYP